MMKNILALTLSLFMSGFVLAAENSLYEFSWLDKDKEIYVLQNRKFRKDGSLYLGTTAVKTVSGSFIDSYGATLRGGYFFSENWGLELVYGKNSGEENDTAKGVREQGTIPYYRKIDSYMGAMAMWSPFYSKINTFNKIFYFDWMFGVGFASINTQDNRAKFAAVPSDALTDENVLGALWNTGFRFYINENWSLRMDFTGLHYKADKTRKEDGAAQPFTSSEFFNNFDFGLGLNYSF
jgi:outer membrane beta-barrel protein